MPAKAPFVLRHGPLTVYVKALDGCPDLASFVASLPPAMPVIWCDSARHHPVTGRWSMVGCDPWLTFVARGSRVQLQTGAATHVWRANPFDALRDVWRRYQCSSRLQPQARGIGLMGFLSYDANRWIERLPEPQPDATTVPEMAWFGMRTVVLVDHLQQRSWLL